MRTIGYEHDPAGNRTELRYSGGGVLTYTATPLVDYDFFGGGHFLQSRTTTTTDGGSYAATYGYDDHRRTDMIQNIFDDNGVETMLVNYSFTHDDRGNPLKGKRGTG